MLLLHGNKIVINILKYIKYIKYIIYENTVKGYFYVYAISLW